MRQTAKEGRGLAHEAPGEGRAPASDALSHVLLSPSLSPRSPVYLGFFLPGKLASNLFDKRPDLGKRGKGEGVRERGRSNSPARDAAGGAAFLNPLSISLPPSL